MYIFVYGSLRHRGQNHWLLDFDTYKGVLKTKEKYYMVCPKSKAFPYCSSKQIIPNIEPTEIEGELYDISPATLKKLDALEGHPTHYTRKTIELENNILADTYLLENDTVVQELKSSGRFIPVPQGDWIKFLGST
jgi:gamma-glutamylcyclotransferase (GGCT)/AIG2-like uncharacterized protein YtfP